MVKSRLHPRRSIVEQSFELSRDVVQPPLRPAEGLTCFRRGVRAELLGRLPGLVGGLHGVGGGLPQRSFGLSSELLESIASRYVPTSVRNTLGTGDYGLFLRFADARGALD